MLKRLALIVLFALTNTSAFSGDNRCEGLIQVGKDWSTVKDVGIGFSCRFKTNSNVGKRILAACPNGTKCAIGIPLGQQSPIINRLNYVEPSAE